MSKPAARIGDKHSCSLETAGVPHEGGPITGPGCASVLIEGMPAATRGDTCFCVGVQDVIIEGSASVYIGGKPAARFSDMCLHGGLITEGSKTVLIGDAIVSNEPAVTDAEDGFGWHSRQERTKTINQAIQDCIAMLEKKLQLLLKNDYLTIKEITERFGRDDVEARKIIRIRIKRALKVSKMLSESNFADINRLDDRRDAYGYVDPTDKSYTIYLGDKFWKANPTGKNSKAGTIVHELSHFKKIGKTKDHAYGEACFCLGKIDPLEALYNAESFEFFIEEVNILDYKPNKTNYK